MMKNVEIVHIHMVYINVHILSVPMDDGSCNLNSNTRSSTVHSDGISSIQSKVTLEVLREFAQGCKRFFWNV